jgi:predicted HD phosphohydrolase
MEYMKPLFDLLDKCTGVTQKVEYHPEGDVLIHSMQTFHYACRETNNIDVLLACLLHDVGKAEDTLNHVEWSVKLLTPYVSCKTLWLVEQHMRVWAYIHGEMQGLKKCVELADHPWFPELVQVARFDNMGRNSHYCPEYDKEDIIKRLNKAVKDHWGKKTLSGKEF